MAKKIYRTKEKNSLLLYYEWEHYFEKLPAEHAKRLLLAMFQYAKNQTEPDFSDDMALELVFHGIKGQIQRDTESYRERCEQNRRNANKRWQNKENDAKDATACDGISGNAKNADNDDDNEDDVDDDDDTDDVDGVEKEEDGDVGTGDDKDASDTNKQSQYSLDFISQYAQLHDYDDVIFNPLRFYQKYSAIGWRTKNGKHIDDVGKMIDTWVNQYLESDDHPNAYAEWQARAKKRKEEAEREAEEKRLRAEEEAKHWQGDTYFTSGQEFAEYLKGRKWTKYDECLANDLYWMSEYTETECGFDHDDDSFTEQELIEMFESGIITVDMQIGITELFHEPDIAICQNDALVAKIRKQQASYKPQQKPPEPEPFIPKSTFDDLQ